MKLFFFLQSFERAMKFSHEQPHVWLQWSLCLISLGRYVHGFAVLKEAVRLSSTKVIPCLLAAKVCYEQLNRVRKTFIFGSKRFFSIENFKDEALYFSFSLRNNLIGSLSF